ncbi:MAG: molybdopterin molybdotransferase MoeA [Chloroflexota bacterium]
MTETKEEFLSVSEALDIVLGGVEVLESENVPLLDALHRVLALPVIAEDDLPPFPNSSMDGYAVVAADLEDVRSDRPVLLQVSADIAAGKVPDTVIESGTAARITTGAPLPPGADAVVPVEYTNEPWRDRSRPLPEVIEVRQAVKPGDYVRRSGEDIRSGTIVLTAGHVIRPQEIGMLASLGYEQIAVYRRPKVGILATGDELIDIRDPLRPGKIRNSNSLTQAAQAQSINARPVLLGVAGDSELSVREKLQKGLDLAVDLFVSSAGVSVGAYDVVKAVLEQDGLVKFWRVRMRPGKPLTFGYYRNVPYLGLPGNPVSALVSFERFTRPALLKMAGHKKLDRPQISVKLMDSVQSDGRESYMRALVRRDGDGYLATTTGGQGSHMMSSLVKANALVIVPEGVFEVEEGEYLSAIMVDWPVTVF